MAESLSDQQWKEIEDRLYAGRKIEAIKVFRLHTGAGLKDAKEVLDQHERELRTKCPERFKKSTGCGAVAAVFLIAIVLVMAVS